MKLLFKQRLFSWLDSYDIYDEHEHTIYSVNGKLSFGHCLDIYQNDQKVGRLKEVVLTLKPQFEMFIQDEYVGCIKKQITIFKPKFVLDCNDWTVEGNWLEWNYQIKDRHGVVIADISKDIYHLTDTYVLDVVKPENALYVLMIVLAIDAQKCSEYH